MAWELLFTAALAAHLLAVSVASAGPLIAAAVWRRGSGGRDERTRLSIRLTKASLTALIVGSLLGGVLLALPNPGVTAALARFPKSLYWYAGAELVFSAFCLAMLWALQRKDRVGRWGAWILAVLSSSNLLYHFPPLMAVFGELVADPAWAPGGLIDHAAMLRLWARPEILALWAHFTLAAMATAAVFALWTIQRYPEGQALRADGDAPRIARRLAVAALIATLLQLPVGVWLVIASDSATRGAILGGSLAASALFLGGLLATFALLQTLVHLALGDQTPAATRRAAWLLIVIVFFMTGTLRLGRLRIDEAAIGAAIIPVQGQGGAAVTSPRPLLPL